MRAQLLETAARVLHDHGPAGLAVRRLAEEAGTSTAAIYSLFGSMDDLVAEVIDSGHDRLHEALAAVPVTDDPMADLTELGHTYRRWALANPALFHVMWAIRGEGYDVPGDCPDLLEQIAPLADAVQRALDAGAMHNATAREIAISMWAATHGMVMLELSGFVDNADAEQRYELQMMASSWLWLVL